MAPQTDLMEETELDDGLIIATKTELKERLLPIAVYKKYFYECI